MYTAFRDEQNKVTASLEQRLKDIENELELAGESQIGDSIEEVSGEIAPDIPIEE